jgi:PAS domain S-box-containing protein
MIRLRDFYFQGAQLMANASNPAETNALVDSAALMLLNRRMAALYAVTKVLSAARTLSDVAPKILEEISIAMSWDASIFWEVDTQSQVMKCKEIWTTDRLEAQQYVEKTRGVQISRTTGLTGRAWSTGKMAWAAGDNTSVIRQGQSVGYVPIQVRGEAAGALQFFSKEEHAPAEHVQEMLNALCTQIGLFLERNRAEETLHESEARYQLLADSSQDVLITIDDESTIVFVNKSSERVFGFTPAELIGQKLTQIIPDHKQVKMISGKSAEPLGRLELTGQKKSGGVINLEVCFAEYLGKGRKYATGIVTDITERRRIAETLQATQQKLQTVLGASSCTQIVVASPAMLTLFNRVKKAGASDASILVQGETGSGKECIALALHQHSQRSSKPFVARNCAAIPPHLFESEMFGHKKGAFTGADRDRKGAFAEADGGTLFLDEIGDLEYTLQTKLLRAIQEKVIHPVGSEKDVPVDPRIVCATNKDLRQSIKNREFRDDLYYRVATVVIEVPPLRDRRDDIIPLARHFVAIASKLSRTLSHEAEAVLLDYAWPGNVRELRSLMENAVIFAVGNVIEAEELSFPRKVNQCDSTSQLLEDIERNHILEVLKKCDGNKTVAAKALGLARSTLVLKLKIAGAGDE